MTLLNELILHLSSCAKTGMLVSLVTFKNVLQNKLADMFVKYPVDSH